MKSNIGKAVITGGSQSNVMKISFVISFARWYYVN